MSEPIIAAIATPRGSGAIGIIRISGQGSGQLLRSVFTPFKKGFSDFEPKYMYYGRLCGADGGLIDLCMAAFFKAPASYTGEDGAELYCHGGAAVLMSAMNALFAAGAVQAKAGEFTKRAFLNGKMDLYEAEAVIELISAQTEAAAKNAAAQLCDKSDNGIAQIRNEFIQILSSFYAEIDFPDEGVPQTAPERVIHMLEQAQSRLRALHSSYGHGKFLKDGVPVAIIGRPNVGKSSLLNLLCGTDRAIVTEAEGTTRDIIDERFCYKDTVFRMYDTAGIRNADDSAEAIGIERARRAAAEAYAVVAVTDRAEGFTEEERRQLGINGFERVIFAANKCDTFNGAASPDGYLQISAKDASGIEQLKEKLYEMCRGQNDSGLNAAITNARQAAAIKTALDAASRAICAARERQTYDIILTEVEAAASALGQITGQTLCDDVINDIFSRFCVGK